jgi:hypothetical protein
VFVSFFFFCKKKAMLSRPLALASITFLACVLFDLAGLFLARPPFRSGLDLGSKITLTLSRPGSHLDQAPLPPWLACPGAPLTVADLADHRPRSLCAPPSAPADASELFSLSRSNRLLAIGVGGFHGSEGGEVGLVEGSVAGGLVLRSVRVRPFVDARDGFLCDVAVRAGYEDPRSAGPLVITWESPHTVSACKRDALLFPEVSFFAAAGTVFAVSLVVVAVMAARALMTPIGAEGMRWGLARALSRPRGHPVVAALLGAWEGLIVFWAMTLPLKGTLASPLAAYAVMIAIFATHAPLFATARLARFETDDGDARVLAWTSALLSGVFAGLHLLSDALLFSPVPPAVALFGAFGASAWTMAVSVLAPRVLPAPAPRSGFTLVDATDAPTLSPEPASLASALALPIAVSIHPLLITPTLVTLWTRSDVAILDSALAFALVPSLIGAMLIGAMSVHRSLQRKNPAWATAPFAVGAASGAATLALTLILTWSDALQTDPGRKHRHGPKNRFHHLPVHRRCLRPRGHPFLVLSFPSRPPGSRLKRSEESR